ncbi:MAG: ABC transporter ATP-binding protein/permease, partial [Acetobacteraceae bacterium]|nr:ABC transporter ATP-binding protein/permease [Acetobacteraceae bacterium]
MAVWSLDAEPTAGVQGQPDRPGGLWRRFWHLATGYYTSRESRSAWGLTAGVLALTLLQIGVQLRLNLWNRDFFNALEHHDRAAFLDQMRLFLLLAAVGIAAAVLQYQTRQTLALRWREWLVRRLQGRLLDDSCHYRMQFLGGAPDNPDQRISENTRWATATAVELAIGLIHSVLLLATFAGILWNLSGPLSLAWGPYGFQIPGYMVFAAVLYAGIGAGLTWALGRAMIGINAHRNQAESDHRFALVRLRENSESVALIRGERDEERGLAHAFTRVVGVMEDLFRRERCLVGLSCAYGMV